MFVHRAGHWVRVLLFGRGSLRFKTMLILLQDVLKFFLNSLRVGAAF
jgi:hypothetical protein